MKHLLIIITLFIYTGYNITYGQCVTNFQILTTDHAVITQKRNGSGKVNNWDWTRDFYSGDVWVIDSKHGGADNICRNIPAPWHNSNQQLSNPNVSHLGYDLLNNKLDVYPVDGWELLTINMGKEIIVAGVNTPDPVSNPSFSIYNRRTGHIKVFMYITNTTLQSSQSVKIRLQYTLNQRGNLIQGGLINHRDSIVLPIAQFKINDVQDVHASYDGIPRTAVACFQEGYWVMGNFWANYDPCSCYPDYEAKVNFEFEFKQDQQINMQIDGDITGEILQDLYNIPNSLYLENNFLKNSAFNGLLNENFLSTAIGIKDGAVKAYKGAESFNKFAMTLVKPQTVGGIVKPPLLKGSLATKLAAKGSVLGPKGMLVAGAIGLTYSFIKMDKKSKPEQPKPLVFESNFKMKLTATGTISTVTQVSNLGMLVPGSPKQPIGAATIPIYNNVLGIFRVTELPTLQYITWSNYGQTSRNGSVYNNFQVRQYKLDDNPIKYIVNPASGLEIESIKAQLVINLNDERNSWLEVNPNVDMDYAPPFTGPFQFGATKYNYCEGENDFEKKINASGLEIVNWVSSAENYAQVVYGTPFVDLPCIHDQTFLLSRNDALNNFKVYIKFHVIFKVVNKFGTQTGPEGSEGLQNDEEELIEYIVTYPININEQPFDNVSRHFCIGNIIPGTNQINCNNYGILDQLNYTPRNYRDDMFFTPINNSPMSPWPNINNKEVLPVSLLFENTSLSGNQNYKAQKNITIGNNVTVQNGSDIYLTAGESIEVSDLFEGEEMVHFNIGLDPTSIAGICEPGIHYNSTPDLDIICQKNGQYFQRTGLSKTDETINDAEHFQTQMINNVRLFPNPVTDYTTIHFNILNDVKINVELFDINGQLISTLASNKFYPIGDYEMPLSLQGLRQGVYLLILTDENGLKMAHKVIKQ